MSEQQAKIQEPSADDYDFEELLACAQALARALGREFSDPEPRDWNDLTLDELVALKHPPSRELVEWAVEVGPAMMAVLESQEGFDNVASALEREKFLADQLRKFVGAIGLADGYQLQWHTTAEGRLAEVLTIVDRIEAEGLREPRVSAAEESGAVRRVSSESGSRADGLPVERRDVESCVAASSPAAVASAAAPALRPTPEKRPARELLQRDLRSLRRLCRRVGVEDRRAAMFLRWRKRTRFDAQAGVNVVRTFQEWEAERFGVCRRTIQSDYAFLIRVGLVWWMNAGSSHDRNPLLGIVKNSRAWRRRWARIRAVGRKRSRPSP